MTTPRPVPGHSRNLTATMRMAFRFMMERINTCLPAIVETFDADTRRARVWPAVQIEIGGEYRDRLQLLDVPVITPFGTEYGLTTDIQEGSVVLLVFSQKGIALFKEAFENGPPSLPGFFSLQDAFAIAGLGPLDLTTALPDGVAMQHVDGERYVGIDEHGIYVVSGDMRITIDAGSGNVTIEGGNVTITGGNVVIEGATTVNGMRIADSGAGTNGASVGDHGSHSHGLTAA